MGSGVFTTCAYDSSIRSMGFASVDDLAASSVGQTFRADRINPNLDPHDVVRECCDSDEHPNTIPVILALDFSGSMAKYAQKCLISLNHIICSLYETIQDIQFMTMGIGDLTYDYYPLQVSQFESDERIVDQLFMMYNEGGGGPNDWESYPLAWFFGLHGTKLDCWNRGKKGIIITIGDEECPPAMREVSRIKQIMGKPAEDCLKQTKEVNTAALYDAASEKFDIFHFSIKQGSHYRMYGEKVDESWKEILGQNYAAVSAEQLENKIIETIKDVTASASAATPASNMTFSTDITW